MYIWHGEVYKDKADVKQLKDEPWHVKECYHALVKTLAKGSFHIKRSSLINQAKSSSALPHIKTI